MAWRPAHSLEVLRDEVNARWPNRDKASDGVIGDAAHAATASDHNPNQYGVVCAFDITHDPANGPDGAVLAEMLRVNQHPDVKYVIWDHRLFSRYGATPFQWRPYSGADPHTNHVHVSVGVGPDGHSAQPYDDLTPPWLTGGTDMPLDDNDIAKIVDALDKNVLVEIRDNLRTVVNILNTHPPASGGAPAGDVPVTGTLHLG